MMVDLIEKHILSNFVLIMIFYGEIFILTSFCKIDLDSLMLKVAYLFLFSMFIIASLDASFFEGICLLAIGLIIAFYRGWLALSLDDLSCYGKFTYRKYRLIFSIRFMLVFVLLWD